MLRALRQCLLLPVLAVVACDAEEIVIATWQPIAPDSAPSRDAEPDTLTELPDAFYLEAEDGALSGALAIESSAAASGGRFVVATEPAETNDVPGHARGVYHFELTQAGDYVLWGRIHSPGADRNRYWLRVDDGRWFLWRISTGEAWHWDDIHDDTDYNNPLVFQMDAGPHQFEIANAVLGAQLDRFYVTARGDRPPGNTTACDPPHSVELAGECIRSCGSHGNVSCEPDLCAGRPNLGAYDCPVCCLLD